MKGTANNCDWIFITDDRIKGSKPSCGRVYMESTFHSESALQNSLWQENYVLLSITHPV